MCALRLFFFFFFFNDTATTEIYTLSLHDALPISAHSASLRRMRERGLVDVVMSGSGLGRAQPCHRGFAYGQVQQADRKSTRLNSSHLVISYAVFCLKKKNTNHQTLLVYPDRLPRA